MNYIKEQRRNTAVLLGLLAAVLTKLTVENFSGGLFWRRRGFVPESNLPGKNRPVLF